jgi:hypothetical protein
VEFDFKGMGQYEKDREGNEGGSGSRRKERDEEREEGAEGRDLSLSPSKRRILDTSLLETLVRETTIFSKMWLGLDIIRLIV